MSTRSNLYEQQRRHIHSLITVAAVAVIVGGGIGIGELRSVLSTSKAESASTLAATSANTSVTPLFETHIANPLSGLKLNAQSAQGLAAGQHLGVSDAR
jgi:hypothetical protein